MLERLRFLSYLGVVKASEEQLSHSKIRTGTLKPSQEQRPVAAIMPGLHVKAFSIPLVRFSYINGDKFFSRNALPLKDLFRNISILHLSVFLCANACNISKFSHEQTKPSRSSECHLSATTTCALGSENEDVSACSKRQID